MIVFSEGLRIVEAEEGKVVLDVRSGVYWHLNDSVIALLEALRDGRAFEDVVRETARAADVQETRVRGDYLAVLQELRQARLIKGELG
ncbi:PqqD family peptide modification chaperone [Streptomyces hainanensis]|uniref:PqqD family protein n=1 Tax=Streptomyces hainanensis TaxID=402648 RepID=A0A4R4TKV7_9ACTN|nr:PqqD family peptide modification chaperone [Streptomyces hainanensis]TDC78638.1 PqqD family protein [Streptomyces hainanensis]